jgi:hypothetical protein
MISKTVPLTSITEKRRSQGQLVEQTYKILEKTFPKTDRPVCEGSLFIATSTRQCPQRGKNWKTVGEESPEAGGGGGSLHRGGELAHLHGEEQWFLASSSRQSKLLPFTNAYISRLEALQLNTILQLFKVYFSRGKKDLSPYS